MESNLFQLLETIQILPYQQKAEHPTPENPNLIPRGRALVWDMTTNTRSPVYDLLPDNLKANSSDKVITVFLIRGTRSGRSGT